MGDVCARVWPPDTCQSTRVRNLLEVINRRSFGIKVTLLCRIFSTAFKGVVMLTSCEIVCPSHAVAI